MLLVDSSERACDIGRVEEYSRALSCLVKEQLSNKSLLYCVHYGTELYKHTTVDFPTDREKCVICIVVCVIVGRYDEGIHNSHVHLLSHSHMELH